MKNSELDDLLRRAKVPEPRAEFWNELPAAVQSSINRGVALSNEGKVRTPAMAPFWMTKLAWSAATAAIVLLLGFLWRPHSGEMSVSSRELADAKAFWKEVAVLFPNQVQAIRLDRQGGDLTLSEAPEQPASPPIFLKVCDANGCKQFVTFSGQQIKVNGESFEVLIDGDGKVLLIGKSEFWQSSVHPSRLGGSKVFAQTLADT